MRRLFLAITLVLVGCGRSPTPTAGPTRLEQRLVEQATATNALQRAIDLAWADRFDEAIAMLSAAATTPAELRLDPVSGDERAALHGPELEDSVTIVELRGAAAQRLFDRMIADATTARSEGRTADADRLCAILQAIFAANATSDNVLYVRPWAATWRTRAQAACP
ncbi:MAG: hypothetical protein U0572_11945 [Phycisphaerales bacterium]